MRERPIGDLVSGLKQLGAEVDCYLGTNCPPVRVVGKGGLPGGKVVLRFIQNNITAFSLALSFIICSCLYGICTKPHISFHSIPILAPKFLINTVT